LNSGTFIQEELPFLISPELKSELRIKVINFNKIYLLKCKKYKKIKNGRRRIWVGGCFFYWIYLKNTIWNLPGSSMEGDLCEGIYG
jgi:hypothetical protein